jgi:hypothetical protein
MISDPGDLLAIGSVFAIYLLGIGVTVFGLVSSWNLFEKAGQPAWTALVPVYATIRLLRIVGKPVWWIAPLLIPVVGLIPFVFVCRALARAFGRGGGFTAGLVLLHVVFLAILAFGRARYEAPTGGSADRQKPLSKG